MGLTSPLLKSVSHLTVFCIYLFVSVYDIAHSYSSVSVFRIYRHNICHICINLDTSRSLLKNVSAGGYINKVKNGHPNLSHWPQLKVTENGEAIMFHISFVMPLYEMC